MPLLKKLCSIPAPSGDEGPMKDFLLEYIGKESPTWKRQPEIIHGDEFQHCIVLVFGQPRTAVFAHMDNIGFHVRYGNELVKIGGPKTVSGYTLEGIDSQGHVECELHVNEEDHSLRYHGSRLIDRGTALNFKMNFREDDHYVQSCYLDNRLGVFNALKLAETLEDGVIVFSCWEEHGGGSVAYLTRYLWERFKIRQALISDITWVTDGVQSGNGVAVSMRDSGIPRRIFIDKIISILKQEHIKFQLEIESSGGSDGNEIQKQPYPIDWCFIGAPEDLVHSPDEKVHKEDISSMLAAYRVLLARL
ncbi:MAG: M20/M25/M40 family metallo-hydrolase [Bacteroidia bacterium]|nr:M20/M25/M40 family metallo-hydrolase [Bacteroidia bacterium]